LALQLGISIKDYEDITPHQLKLAHKAYVKSKEFEVEEYQIKLKQQQDLMTIQAFMISRWVWEKKIDVENHLNFGAKAGQKEKKIMTAEQMLRQVEQLNAIFGGEVIRDGTK
jgi:hypothetical protein